MSGLANNPGKKSLTAMSETTTLSAKGQIVIPKGVRDAHDWQPGTGFEVIDRPDGVLLRPLRIAVPRLSLAAFRAAVAPHEGPVVTLAEMDAAVAAAAAGDAIA